MDPFTERMLERSRARREKLNAQLNGIGQLDVISRKQPLHYIQSNESIPSKSDDEFKTMKSDTNIVADEGNFSEGKENSSLERRELNLRNSARSRLKRLGALYSNNADFSDPNEMPSPIHRSELKDYKDEVSPVKKTPVHTVQRLAALANHINHWEDDLSHPKAKNGAEDETCIENPSPDLSHASKEATGAVKRGLKNQASCSEIGKRQELRKFPDCISPRNSPQKPPRTPTTNLVLDREVIANLESQGFRPSVSGSRLVYDYAKPSPQGRKQDTATKVNGQEQRMTGVAPLASSGMLTTPTGSPSCIDNRGVEGKKLTPRQHLGPPAQGSVLHRAAMFESPTRSPKAKDPAELSVAERKALFEKNKGQALIPKAAFSMAVPAKQLASSPQKVGPSLPRNTLVHKAPNSDLTAKVNQASDPNIAKKHVTSEVNGQGALTVESNTSAAGRKVMERCHIFERGERVQSLENDILKSVKSERQRELELLMNRWNHQKEVTSTVTKTEQVALDAMEKQPQKNEAQLGRNQPFTPPPRPPPMPPSFTSPPSKPQWNQHTSKDSARSSPLSSDLPSTSPHSERISSLASVRKIKVSPAKPGCLYPCLSDIEATESEMDCGEESEGENESFGDLERSADESESSSDCTGIDTSFGREIFQAAGIEDSVGKKRGVGTLSTAEKAVFDEMDELLDEAIAEECNVGGPTPPKRRSGDRMLSPKMQLKEHDVYGSSLKVHGSNYMEEHVPAHIVDSETHLPLMHTVSFYRKQQAQSSLTPSDHIVHVSRDSGRGHRGTDKGGVNQDQQDVQEKIKSLLDEVSRQQTIISQASQALNLCSSTIEFSESAEQVEGERLLLIATHRRQAALNEIQRLKVEGTLWPKQNPETEDAVSQGLEKGDLDISGITLPLKKEFLQKVANGDVDFTHHFVCLVKHQENVISTEMLSTAHINRSHGRLVSSLQFSNNVRLSGLYSDFKVTLEVYGLQVRKEVLSHEAKYHIRKDNSKIRLTPKKILKQESNLIMPVVQSPAGPLAVRSTAFSLAGYVVFSLRELSRVQWILNKVPYSSPLEGVVQMKLSCQLEQNIEERGFLTMFEDISGFGAWHRRWCLLHEDRISFWKYPEDERKKEPIGWINLNACSNESVGPVPRHICARPNTFLLETKRAALPEDRDSLIVITSPGHTTIRHLLSADSKEERQLWCLQINKAIRSLRAWGPKV